MDKETMIMKYFMVDAFADGLFQGNQAGVCLLDSRLDDKTLQNIASENNLSETAFLIEQGDYYELRWFTPKVEIDLCGHATLASAFVIFNYVDPKRDSLSFHTMSGVLTVKRASDLYEMDFPARMPTQTSVTALMEQAIGAPVREAHRSRDLLLLLDSEQQVKSLQPDFDLLAKIPDCFAVIVTAKGKSADFVSRFFAPNAGVLEDPVTGSSHATLIPFWAERLNKGTLIVRQLSNRGGTLYCENCLDRVRISGKAVLYLQGEIHLG